MFYRLPGRAIGEVTRMLQKKGGLVYGGVINSKITLSGKVCSVFDLGDFQYSIKSIDHFS